MLNALGLYPLSPASGDYVLGAPLFANVSIALDGTSSKGGTRSGNDDGGGGPASPRRLYVVAVNQAPDHAYVQSVAWNGAALTSGVTVPYADLAQGGELRFEMGPDPPATAARPA